MSSPFLAEIRICAFNFAPKGWALCNGQLLPINQNQALFSLMGTTYGGNGTTNFQLPNLQGRVPLHQGPGFTWGQVGGEVSHTVTLSETPAHVHSVRANKTGVNQAAPGGAYFGNAGLSNYNTSHDVGMAPAGVANAGGSQPHNNMSPYLVLNFVIALVGIFPSRN